MVSCVTSKFKYIKDFTVSMLYSPVRYDNFIKIIYDNFFSLNNRTEQNELNLQSTSLIFFKNNNNNALAKWSPILKSKPIF